jgi:hypothetical protein
MFRNVYFDDFNQHVTQGLRPQAKGLSSSLQGEQIGRNFAATLEVVL